MIVDWLVLQKNCYSIFLNSHLLQPYISLAARWHLLVSNQLDAIDQAKREQNKNHNHELQMVHQRTKQDSPCNGGYLPSLCRTRR